MSMTGFPSQSDTTQQVDMIIDDGQRPEHGPEESPDRDGEYEMSEGSEICKMSSDDEYVVSENDSYEDDSDDICEER